MYKQVVLITKYFVPYSNVDTNAVYDLITRFLAEDPQMDIHVVTSASNYKTDIKLREFDEKILNKITVHHVKALQVHSESKYRKMLYGLHEGFRLVKKAKNLNIETVITLSNPPLIIAWATHLLRNRNLIYWSFDLYPDAFAADGILKKKSLVYLFFEKITYKISPRGLLALGQSQFDHLKEKFQNPRVKKFLLPCGIHAEHKTEQKPAWYNENKINIAYVGNIGKAHSAEFLKNFIKLADKYEDIHFFLAIYGYHAKEIKQHVSLNSLQNIHFTDRVAQNEMAYIDIQLVSLNESWTHISVPSKAVSAVCSGSTLWYNGSKASDTWQMFQSCSYYSGDNEYGIDKILAGLNHKDVKSKKTKAKKIARELVELESKTIRDLTCEL